MWKKMWKTWKNYVQNPVENVENPFHMWIMPKIFDKVFVFSTKIRKFGENNINL